MIREPLFKGTLTHPATQYVGVPIHDGIIGVHIAWPDATSSATITLELTSYDSIDAPVTTAGTADLWNDVSATVAITGPAASARGSAQVNVENVRQRRARLKIVTAATSTFTILDGAQP
jgi:hypothetical protein